MVLIPTSVDYTDKDFDALLARLKNTIPSVFPDWSDFNVANFGNMLVEAFSFVTDVLTFYQDNQANEGFVLTATQRRSLIALGKLVGYKPNTAAAATTDVTLAMPAALAGDVVIPAGSIVKTAEVTDPVKFQLLADATIVAGTTSTTATVENSESQEELFSSDDTPDQEFVLSVSPYLDGSLEISAGDGAYDEVDNLLASTSTDRHYTVTVDQNDRATIRFGNGIIGKIPTGTISATYKTGGGTLGNVEQGAIRLIEGTFSDTFGTSAPITVTNPSAVGDGLDRETVDEIKILMPESVRVQGRSVAREDFEIVAKKLPGVGRALMTTSNEDPGVAENSGILYLIPPGGGVPSQALKDLALSQFAKDGPYPATLTFKVFAQDPLYYDVDVFVRVFRRAGFSPTTTGAAIRAALEDFFQVTKDDGTPNDQIDFGFNYKDVDGNVTGELPLSDIFNVIRDLPSIRKIGTASGDFLLNGLHKDIELEARQFPRLGSVTIKDGDTGADL